MIEEWQWSAGDAYAVVSGVEKINHFNGSALLIINGVKYGPWDGGQYGVGTEFKDLETTLFDMAVFLYWEIDNYDFKGKAELLELVARGRGGATGTFYSSRDEPVDDLLRELADGRELLKESMKELSNVDPFLIPKYGPQLTLF